MRIEPAILLAAVLCGPAWASLWSDGVPVIPLPKEVAASGAAFTLAGGVRIESGAAGRFTAEDLALRLERDFGIRTNSGSGVIVLTRSGAPARVGAEGYQMIVEPARITIAANTDAGLFYGTRTLLGAIQRGASGPYVAGGRIVDWPDIPHRAVHYDTKHHQDKPDYVREFIRTLADYKINTLVWEWEDKFAYRSHPEIGAPGAFTMAEMQEFTRYARRYHVQIVPLVQGLGHVSFILKWPQNAAVREIADSNWEFCPRKDASYKLLFDLWDEAMEATPGSEYIHIGTDETYELGRGVECGCAARASSAGRHALLLDFLDRCAAHFRDKNRKVMAWAGAWQPGAVRQPPAGLLFTEFDEKVDRARASRDAGYPAWVYDPNPGIEHLFLPYFHKLNDAGKPAPSCLERSYKTLAPAAASGVYDGMIATSWDDSGLHNQMWMMRFIHAAQYAWNGSAPPSSEFVDAYFRSYYGPRAANMRELWDLLNDGAYFYMDTFEHKMWHWGNLRPTHAPELPRGDALEYDASWTAEYRDLVERARREAPRMERALEICRRNRAGGALHPYDFELFETIANLIAHTARAYTTLASVDAALLEANRAHFVSHRSSYADMERAAGLIQANIEEREKVFAALVETWEKTRFPKGMSTPDKPYFHQQDRARHFANRRPDMTYLIHDERRTGIDNYLRDLHVYMEWYRKQYLP